LSYIYPSLGHVLFFTIFLWLWYGVLVEVIDMSKTRPQTVSICLVRKQLDVLDALGAELSERAEPVSRSGLVRQALNVGLEVLAERIRRGGSGTDKGPGTPDGAGVSAAAA
jgi:hypothetical protein